MGGRLRSYRVRTVYGTALVEAETLLGDLKILLAPNAHALVQRGKRFEVPAGVAYVHNTGLVRDTRGEAWHLLIPGGLYALARMCSHIKLGTRREAKDLSGRVADMRATAHFLHVSGMMNGDERREILGRIAQLELVFAPPKRVEEKLAAAGHLETARRLRQSGPNRVASSARTAHVAATEIEKRIRTLFGHQGFFSIRVVYVVGCIVAMEQRVNALWEFLTNSPTSTVQGGDTSRLAYTGPIQKVFELHAANFAQMAYRPFRDVAQLVVRNLQDFNRALAAGDADRITAAHGATVRTVRRLIMISHIERELIGRASMMAEFRKRAHKPPHAQSIRALRGRLSRMLARLNEMTKDDLDLDLLYSVRSLITDDIEALDLGQFVVVSETLKRAVSLLAGYATGARPVASTAA